MAIKIAMKEKTYSGRRAGVTFTNGVGYTEGALNDGQLFNFARWGYTVTGNPDEDHPASAPEVDAVKVGVVKGGR